LTHHHHLQQKHATALDVHSVWESQSCLQQKRGKNPQDNTPFSTHPTGTTVDGDMVVNPKIYRVLYIPIPVGAGFLPSNSVNSN